MNELLSLTQFFTTMFLVKLIAGIITLGYVFFSFVVYNQAKAMNNVIHIPSSFMVTAAAVVQIIFALSLFVLSLVIL